MQSLPTPLAMRGVLLDPYASSVVGMPLGFAPKNNVMPLLSEGGARRRN